MAVLSLNTICQTVIYVNAMYLQSDGEEKRRFMKNCENCGTANEDERKYCSTCGQELKAAAPVAQTVPYSQPAQSGIPNEHPYASSQGQPYYTQPAESPYTYYNAPVQNYPNAVQSAREILSSPLMLTVIIFLALQSAVSVILSIITLDVNKTQDVLNTYTSSIHFSSSGAIVAVIPSILLIVGLLMVYLSAKKTSSPMSTAGITMLRVLMIIYLVFLCIGIAALLLIAMVCLGGSAALTEYLAPYFGSIGEMNLSTIISMVGFAFIAAAAIGGTLGIVFYTSAIKFLGSINQTFQTGYLSSAGAGVFSVFCFIFGIISALASFLSFINIDHPVQSILGFITVAASAVTLILLGTLASKYKKEIDMY